MPDPHLSSWGLVEEGVNTSEGAAGLVRFGIRRLTVDSAWYGVWPWREDASLDVTSTVRAMVTDGDTLKLNEEERSDWWRPGSTLLLHPTYCGLNSSPRLHNLLGTMRPSPTRRAVRAR